jgi:hypothetical protein
MTSIIIKASYWLVALAIYVYIAYEGYRSWKLRDWWPQHVEAAAMWKRYFHEQVVADWTFYDGRGY